MSIKTSNQLNVGDKLVVITRRTGAEDKSEIWIVTRVTRTQAHIELPCDVRLQPFTMWIHRQGEVQNDSEPENVVYASARRSKLYSYIIKKV